MEVATYHPFPLFREFVARIPLATVWSYPEGDPDHEFHECIDDLPPRHPARRPAPRNDIAIAADAGAGEAGHARADPADGVGVRPAAVVAGGDSPPGVRRAGRRAAAGGAVGVAHQHLGARDADAA